MQDFPLQNNIIECKALTRNNRKKSKNQRTKYIHDISSISKNDFRKNTSEGVRLPIEDRKSVV